MKWFKKLNRLFKPKAKKSQEDFVAEQRALATERGEPWVHVISFSIDPDDPKSGVFELDYNDIFLARLIRAGYRGQTDQQIVDQWFISVCRSVIQENFEQIMADPEKRNQDPS
jgi:hypothetical protein